MAEEELNFKKKLGMQQSFNGLMGSAYAAQSIGASTCQVFMRNNRNCHVRSFGLGDYINYNSYLQESSFTDLVVHGVYTVNPVTVDWELYEKTVRVTQADLDILANLKGNKYYVLHPGSSQGQNEWDAIQKLSDFLHELAPAYRGTKMCVELMAGQGTQLLDEIPHIYQLLKLCEDIPEFAFTVDTCHVWGAGIRFDWLLNLLKNFDKKYLGVVHANNSQNPFGSKRDRHASVFHGEIPTQDLIDTIKEFSAWNPDCPIILESPADMLLHDYQLLKLVK